MSRIENTPWKNSHHLVLFWNQTKVIRGLCLPHVWTVTADPASSSWRKIGKEQSTTRTLPAHYLWKDFYYYDSITIRTDVVISRLYDTFCKYCFITLFADRVCMMTCGV